MRLKWCGVGTVAVVLIIVLQTAPAVVVEKGKFCIGTEDESPRMLWADLKARYEGCTHIVGNLEMKGLQSDEEEESAFLQDIEEIEGYLLIEAVTLNRLTFSSLHTIRGKYLFRVHVGDPEYALLVVGSWIEHLEFPVLTEISKGSVGMYFEKRMCFLETINWRDIMMEENAQFHYFSSKDRLTGLYVKGSQNEFFGECEKCDASCVSGCWGRGAHRCQKLSKLLCKSECRGGHCFGGLTGKCCHFSCVGGCTGPTRKDCSGCRNAYLEEECKDCCPPGKFAFATTCLNTCPNGTVLDEERKACLFKCPHGKNSKFGKCESMQLSTKLCRRPSYYDHIHSGNIEHFRNCTVLNGNIFIDSTTFSGGAFRKNLTSKVEAAPMPPEKLDVFNSLQEIKGTVKLWYVHIPQFVELTWFKNLEVIGLGLGRRYALDIRFTSLKRVRLKNLRAAKGDVQISQNSELCYVDGVNWTAIARNGAIRIANNRGSEECTNDGEICSRECSSDGCWGPHQEDCVCLGYMLEGQCVSSCPEGTYNSGVNCRKCHKNCKGGCRGPFGAVDENGCKPCHNAIIHGDGTIGCLRNEMNLQVAEPFSGWAWPSAVKKSCKEGQQNCEGGGYSGPSRASGEFGKSSCRDELVYCSSIAVMLILTLIYY